MDSNQFMGLLIAAIVVLLGIATGIATLIIKPIMNLNKSIVKLNDSIDRLNEDNQNLSSFWRFFLSEASGVHWSSINRIPGKNAKYS